MSTLECVRSESLCCCIYRTVKYKEKRKRETSSSVDEKAVPRVAKTRSQIVLLPYNRLLFPLYHDSEIKLISRAIDETSPSKAKVG